MARLHKPYHGAVTVDMENTIVDIPAYTFKVGGVALSSANVTKLAAVTASAAELNIIDGVTSSTAELNLVDDMMATATIAYAAGAANTLTATITVKDAANATIAAVHSLQVFISRDATGATMTSTAASGALTATTGEIQGVLTAKKSVVLNTNASGVAVLSLVDTAKTQGERFCVVLPRNGKIVVGGATVTADYG